MGAARATTFASGQSSQQTAAGVFDSTDAHHRSQPAPGQLLEDASDRFDDGKVGDAIALARRAAALGGGAPAHALLGHIYMSQGELDRAERELAQAVRMNPGDTEAADRLADVRRARREQQQ